MTSGGREGGREEGNVPSVLVESYDHPRTIPIGAVAPVIPPATRRNDTGELAIGSLFGLEIVQPAVIKCTYVIVVAASLSR